MYVCVCQISSSRASVIAAQVVHWPQVVAAVLVLGLHWDDDGPCDAAHRTRWKVWCLFSALRMAVYCLLVW